MREEAHRLREEAKWLPALVRMVGKLSPSDAANQD